MSSIKDDYSYLIRDYSSFIKWSNRKIGQLTEKWTDFTISEPDVLLLSYLANTVDLTSYIIDNKYLSSTLEKIDIDNLYRLSRFTGKLSKSNNEIKVPVLFTNIGDKTITIDETNPIVAGSEVFSLTEQISIGPNGRQMISSVVRGTSLTTIFNTTENPTGEYRINGKIEVGSIQVESVGFDGTQSIVPRSDSIYNSFLTNNELNEANMDEVSYTIYQNGEGVTIKSSQSLQNQSSLIIVSYSVIDDFPVKVGTELQVLGYPEIYGITTEQVEIVSDIPMKTQKLNYINNLTAIDVFYNNKFNIDLGFLKDRILYHYIYYETDVSSYYPTHTIYYISNDDTELDEGSYYVNSTISGETLTIRWNFPNASFVVDNGITTYTTIYNMIIEYESADGVVTSVYSPIVDRILLPGITDNFKIYLVSSNNDKILYYDNSRNEIIETELSYLASKVQGNLLSNYGGMYPDITKLESVTINLVGDYYIKSSSTNITKMQLLTDVVNICNQVIINENYNIGTYLSQSYIKGIIISNIDYISDIKFINTGSDKIFIRYNQYLRVSTPVSYAAQTTLHKEGDE